MNSRRFVHKCLWPRGATREAALGRALALVAALLACAASVVRAEQQPTPPASARQGSPVLTPTGDAKVDVASISVPRLVERLAALRPDQPAEYFKLAEDCAAEASVPAARALARQLYVLAFELDRASSKAQGLGPSVCLGLAALASAEPDRRWLRAMAVQLSDARGAVAGAPSGPASATGGTDAAKSAASTRTPASARASARLARSEDVSDATALDVCAYLSAVRTGRGRVAERLLQQPGVSETLEAYAGLMTSASGESSPLDRLRRQMQQWPMCPECTGKRYISRVDSPGAKPRPRVCPTCGGTPGPRILDDELLSHLRLESALLHGVQRSWAAQVLADDARPLRDPDPSELAALYQVDRARPLWRDGRWSAATP